MSVYLHDIPLSEAREHFEKSLRQAGLWDVFSSELIPLDEFAVGRTLAAPVWARMSSPHYHASAMDGFAVDARQTAGADSAAPILLNTSSQAQRLDTGDPLPTWANAVIPIEQVEPLDENGHAAAESHYAASIRIRSAVTPWSYVRPVGEDIIASQLVLPEGLTLRPVDLGAVAAGGHSDLHVVRRPTVAIIPTGTELVPIGSPVLPGDIIEYNSIVLAGMINQFGGKAVRLSPVPDQFETICQALQLAVDAYDLVLVNAGSSAGSEDYTASVVTRLGELLVHGVAVRPGHPVILGLVNRSDHSRQVPVIGVPGYPVSSALTCEIFIEPLLAHWLGRNPHQPIEVEALITRKITSPAGDDDYLRVVAGYVGEKLLAAPLSRGAGVITSLVKADGITILPRGVQGVESGTPVRVRLYRSPAELKNTIFAIGSHDLTLDLVSQFLSHKNRRLVSANVGSQAGLVALSRGEAHLAGSHLLDPQTGEYNLSFIKQYLPLKPVVLMIWAGREQGLLIKKGNPLGITSLLDLARPDVIFVNRQRGSGTRVLLDFHLAKMRIDFTHIKGYDQEEYTHLAVAASVASGRANCGLGITAAAKALDLDFVPLFTERYDLVIPCEFANSELLAPLFDLANDLTFRQVVATMPGYDLSQMGKTIINCS